MENTGSWPPQWLRGPLPLCVLQVLKGEPAHGYAIVKSLEELLLMSVGGGTLYPVLTRLQREGFLTAEWTAGEGAPGRKVYSLTDQGAAELAEQSQLWRRFAAVTSQALASEATTGNQK